MALAVPTVAFSFINPSIPEPVELSPVRVILKLVLVTAPQGMVRRGWFVNETHLYLAS